LAAFDVTPEGARQSGLAHYSSRGRRFGIEIAAIQTW
jgi:hypothetical protein